MLNSGKLKLTMKEGRQRGRNTGKTRLRTWYSGFRRWRGPLRLIRFLNNKNRRHKWSSESLFRILKVQWVVQDNQGLQLPTSVDMISLPYQITKMILPLTSTTLNRTQSLRSLLHLFFHKMNSLRANNRQRRSWRKCKSLPSTIKVVSQSLNLSVWNTWDSTKRPMNAPSKFLNLIAAILNCIFSKRRLSLATWETVWIRKRTTTLGFTSNSGLSEWKPRGKTSFSRRRISRLATWLRRFRSWRGQTTLSTESSITLLSIAASSSKQVSLK